MNSVPKPTTEHSEPSGPYTLAGYCVDESVGYLIKRVRMAMSSAIDREMAHADISHDQWSVLILIASGKADTAAELSREAGVDTGSMTRMIDRLEAKDLVIRTRSADDRRVVRLALSPAGRTVCDQMPEVMVKVLNRHLAGFSGSELEALKGFLRRMLVNAAASSNQE